MWTKAAIKGLIRSLMQSLWNSINSWDSRSTQYGAGDTRNGYCLTLHGDSVVLVHIWTSLPGDRDPSSSLQQHEVPRWQPHVTSSPTASLPHPAPQRGASSSTLSSQSCNKKLYGNSRVSFTQRLIQQPLLRFSFWSFQVILYLEHHNNLFCNSVLCRSTLKEFLKAHLDTIPGAI